VTDTVYQMTPQEEAVATALHLMRHEHGDLWPVEPGCGCGDWAVTLVRNLKDGGWTVTQKTAPELLPWDNCPACGERVSRTCPDCYTVHTATTCFSKKHKPHPFA
jgi:hypothetical protein